MLIPCPVCQRPVPQEAHACPACGHPNQVNQAANPNASPAGAIPNGPAEAMVHVYTSGSGPASGSRSTVSNVQPVWQYVLLQICSFGFYDLIWFFATWSLLKERHRLYITPAARAFFSILFANHLCREIYKLSAEAGMTPKWRPGFIGGSYILLEVIANRCMWRDETVIYAIGVGLFIASIVVRIPLVNTLNDFWRHEQPGLPERNRLSGKAWVVVVVGGLMWISIVTGMVLGPSVVTK